MSNLIIRSYRPQDRPAVRAICCDSADRGEPIERTFPDRDWAADLLSAYYTDYEPSSVFVAEDNGAVVGYIFGCLDNRRYGLVMLWLLGPQLLVTAFTRGVFFQRHVWEMIGTSLRNWKRLFHWRKTSFHSHQAHMHIGIAKGHRGKHIGRQLVEALVGHAKLSGVTELTASVHDGNPAGVRFFEHAGFHIEDRYPMIMLRGRDLEHYNSLFFVRKILLILVLLGLCGPLFCASARADIADLTLSANDRVLVLAPHPDDEVLGAGGILQKAVVMKLPVKVIFFTYGDSNQWSFLLYRRHFVFMPWAVEKMGLVRRDEALAASSILGVPLQNLVFLGYPDFGTMNIWYAHWNDRPPLRSLLTRVTRVPYQGAMRPGAPYKGEEIVQDLRTIIHDFKPTKIFVSHPADHNGDHLSLYLYTRIALWDENMESQVQLYPYLVHYLGWPKPLGYHPDRPLLPPEFLKDTMVWTQYHLTPHELDFKKAALEAHKSQYASTPRYLMAFIKQNELFGDFPPIHLHVGETSPIFSARRKFIPQGGANELNSQERQAFVGVEWKFVRWEKDRIVISIDLTKPLAQNVGALIYVFGYNPAVPFKQMPKISVRLGTNSYTVYDQTRRIEQGSVKVMRTANEVQMSVPLNVLKNPDRILTCALTYLGNVPLDHASWLAVETVNPGE